MVNNIDIDQKCLKIGMQYHNTFVHKRKTFFNQIFLFLFCMRLADTTLGTNLIYTYAQIQHHEYR